MDSKLYDFNVDKINPGLFKTTSVASRYKDTGYERYGGFNRKNEGYFTSESKPLAAKSKFTYL
jgi:hypothetical protein